jgi:recombination protein RecA
VVIFINQIRMKIGVMFGNPETTTGGNALKFYASLRMDIRRIGALKEGETIIGGRTRVKVVKNKMAPPFKEAEFDILYGTGISREGELLDLGSEMGVMEKSGAWYSFNGERIGQGRESAKEFLREHAEIGRELRARILEKAGLQRAGAEPAASVQEKREKAKGK